MDNASVDNCLATQLLQLLESGFMPVSAYMQPASTVYTKLLVPDPELAYNLYSLSRKRHFGMNKKLFVKLIFAAILSSQAWTVLAEAPAWQQQAEWTDWIHEPFCDSLCGGHYEPLQLQSRPAEGMLRLPVFISANEANFSWEGASELSGDVLFRQGDRNLHADYLKAWRNPITEDWDHFLATGHIHYWSPGLNVFADEARYDHNQREFMLERATYHWYARNARGYAESLRIDCNHLVHLTRADYTTCAPGQNTWQLTARDITLNPNTGRATVKHFVFRLKDFPIFYFPYFNYPADNKRHSGFLFPGYGQTSNSGYEISIPYYWNIAPNYDMVLTGRLLSERGFEAQTKFRYLWQNGEGIFQWHILPDDRKYAAFKEDKLMFVPFGLSVLDPQIKGLDTSSTRQAINYQHHSNFGSHWVFNVKYGYVSDDNYFVDLGNDINTASIIYLPQQANLSYFGTNWSHYFNVEEYQVLEPFTKPLNEEIYKRQPQWVFQAIYPRLIGCFTFTLNGEAVNFEHRRALITDQSVTTGERYHLRPSLSLPLEDEWYRLIPRAQVDWLYYSLSLGEDVAPNGIPTHPSRAIPMLDVDGTLIFERNFCVLSRAFKQTLEPRAYYLYVPYRAQYNYPDFDSGVIEFSYSQLFRDNRFSGRDRIGDANQVSLSLTSRILPEYDGKEYLRASIGQIFYFRTRLVSLCEQLGYQNNCYLYEDTSAPNAFSKHSNLMTLLESHPSDLLALGAFWEWDSTHGQTDQAGVSFQYRPTCQKVLNFNYYWLRDDLQQTNFETGKTGNLHQTDFSILWPLTLHWEWIARWQYDITHRQNVEILGGIEYNGCCVALQLVASRYREGTNFVLPQCYANAFFVQIVFKGLSALGLNNPDNKLAQRIPGYTPLADRQKWLMQPNRSFFPQSDIPLY